MTTMANDRKVGRNRRWRLGLKVLPWLGLVLTILAARTLVSWGCGAANGKPNVPNGNGLPSCSPFSSGQPSSPSTAGDPVLIAQGAAVEKAIDIVLPGPTFPFTHRRSYSSDSSMASEDPYNPLPAIQGNHWRAGLLEMVLSVEGNGIAFGHDAMSKRVYDANNVGPGDFHVDLTTPGGDFKLATRLLASQGLGWPAVFPYATFYRTDDADTRKAGLLHTLTDAYSQKTISFSYDSGAGGGRGRIAGATVAQGWSVVYSYIDAGVNIGRISQIDVKNGSAQVIQRVKYTYLPVQDGHADVGSDGDLAMVEKLERASADSLSGETFSIQHVTQYRYQSGSRMTHVIEPGDVERILAAAAAAQDNTITTAAHILKKANSYSINGKQLKEYASRSYVYHANNEDTTSVNTGWSATENLEEKYNEYRVGGNPANSRDETGFVKQEIVRGRRMLTGEFCGNGITRTYHYLDTHNDTTADKVKWIIVEDLQDSASANASRHVYGVNNEGMKLREAFIDDVNSPQYWCDSRLVVTDSSSKSYNQASESRLPSVHAGKVSDNSVAKFLNPTGNSGANDTDTSWETAGVVYTFTFNSDGLVTDTKVKQGRGTSQPAYYVSATDYSGRLPSATYEYPTRTQTRNDGKKTEYYYNFHASESSRVKTVKTVLPEVTTSENGPGNSQRATTYQYYDDCGRLRWSKDATGHVTYYAYNEKTGGLAYTVEDIDTGSMPVLVGNPPGSNPDEWTPWSGNPPSQEEGETYAYDFATTNGLNLASECSFDDQGRPTRTKDPKGAESYIVYEDNRVLVFPAWNGTTQPLLPIEVTEVNDYGRPVRRYTVDPTKTAASGNKPTGISTDQDTQSNYYTLTKYSYNTDALLQYVDSYHSIPSSGDTISTHFYRRAYKYDNQGRRTHVIAQVSGAPGTGGNGVEQVTRLVYDKKDRVIQVDRGVSLAGADMGSSYGTDPTLDKVLQVFFDESTIGSGTAGAGDGLVTSTRRYFDTGTNTCILTKRYHDWRGRLRGWCNSSHNGTNFVDQSPYYVQDVDNLGRVTATASYVGALTWSTVVGMQRYAEGYEDDGDPFTNTNRRTLSVVKYDVLGQVYRTERYAVQQTGSPGATNGKVVTDRFYDLDGQLVGVTSPGSPSLEYAYDGAGRLTQRRVVSELRTSSGNHYSGGSFIYRDPTPTATTNDADGVLEIAVYEYDEVGNATRSIRKLVNSGASGIDLDAGNFVQTATYRWFEDKTYYLKTSAYYGSGDTEWKNASLPTYETYANRPTASSSSCLVTNYEYEKDLVSKVIDAKGLPVLYTYDCLDRVLRVQEKNAAETTINRTTLTEYDGLSNVTREIADVDNDDSLGTGDVWADATAGDDQITVYSYADAHDATLATKLQYPDGDANNDNVQLTYALDGQVATRTSQKHSGEDATTITFNYDNAFRQLTKRRVTAFGTGVYGANSETETDAVRAIWIGYDDLRRREKVTSYTSNSETSPGTPLNEVKFEYDDIGRVSKEYQEHEGAKDDDSLFVQYDYASGANDFPDGLRLTRITYPNERELNYDYGAADGLSDKLSRLAALKDDNGTTTLAAYSWSGLSLLVKEELSEAEVSLDLYDDHEGEHASGVYDGLDRFGRVKRQTWYRSTEDHTSNVDQYAYDYDYNSNRKYRENRHGTDKKDELYHYDDLDRLTAFERGNLDGELDEIPTSGSNRARGAAWGLSPTGNWNTYQVDATGDGAYNAAGDLNQARDHNKANELADDDDAGTDVIETAYGDDWANPVHDARGNLKTIPQPTAPTQSYACVYDAWDRLVKVSTTGGSPLAVAKYEYDGLRRRVKTAFDSHAPDSFTGTLDRWRHFYYDASWRLVETRQDDADVAPETLYAQAHFVWSERYVNAPVLRDEYNSAGQFVKRLYYTTDANMNVTALLRYDSSGQFWRVAERYAYDPYGQVTVLNGPYDADSGVSDWSNDADNASDYGNKILFAGYWRDADSGLYFVGHRVYHALLGRWLQRDPIGYVDGMSLYEYCGGMPCVARDPSGTLLVNPSDHLNGAGGGERSPEGVAKDELTVFLIQYYSSIDDFDAKWSIYSRTEDGQHAIQVLNEVINKGGRNSARLSIIAQMVFEVRTTFVPICGTNNEFWMALHGVGLSAAAQPLVPGPSLAPPLPGRMPTRRGAPVNAATRGMGGRVLSAAEKAEFDAFAARARAQGLTESPYRTGSWGKMENGKFVEKTRVDVGEAGKPGFRGQTHTHIEGQDGHLDPSTKLPGEQ